MPEYKKFNRSGGAPNRSFNKGGYKPGGRDFGAQKELFEAECNSCHKMCQVPFRPNGMKPVYCRDCFKPSDEQAPRGRFDKFEKKDYGAPRTSAPAQSDKRIDDIKRQLETMNTTLEKILASLEASNRAVALSKELSKHIAPKEEEKKPAKKATKVAAKKPAKKAK